MFQSQLQTTATAAGKARALLLGATLPLLLLTAACSGEAPGTSASGATAHNPTESLAGLGYVGGDEAPAAAQAPAAHSAAPAAEPAAAAPEKVASAPAAEPGGPGDTKAQATAAAASLVDDHAGHDHAADDGHDHANEPQGPIVGVDEVMKPADIDSDEGPRLTYELGQEKHEFGRLMEGSVAEHTFELSNTGNEDLVIKQVKPTCGCTVAEVYTESDDGEMKLYTFGDPIAPGRKIHFPAKLHTKNKSGHSNTRINIFSNDPRGTIQLGLVADIDPFFNIAPRFLNFGQVSLGEEATQSASISAARGKAIKLEVVEQPMPPGTTIDLVPINPDGDGRAARWDLKVSLGKELMEGNLARSIVIKSDEEIPGAELDIDGKPSTYQATLTINAQVVGPFTYQPAYLSMGLVRPGQVQVRTVQIECHDPSFSFSEHAPVVKVVGLQNPGTETFRDWEFAQYFTPTVRPVAGKNAVDVELRLEGLPEEATGSFRGTLVIELDHPSKKQIPLVVTGVCRGGPVGPK
ncbi:MAG: DUF1573 domain-containing protein [Planctomycetes bacterium]|nr:DUF1573 domain-containing protein [Planctomycetota bacterium]